MTFEVLFAIGWAVVLGLGGGALTDIGKWYHDLAKPSWQPPNWLFGPAWTLILGLAGWAFVLAWRGTSDQPDRAFLLTLYGLNFLFHFLWSPLFFKLRRPDWALVEVVFLWLSVLSLLIFLRQWSVLASWLILPYFVWVSFAAILNLKIVQLNPSFAHKNRS